MTVKTSQENKEFWRKTKFLHILGVVLAGFLPTPVPLSHSVPGFLGIPRFKTIREQFLHTGKNHEKILSFSQKNRIFLEMIVKTSQENKEFWRKTKFLHIFPSAAQV